jgi:hypothetical protein
MSINQMFAERTRKHIANSIAPTEREWALSQPTEWQYACLAFAVASNTRGGVVGKSEERIVRESNEAGIQISLRTFKRRVSLLQAHGIVYMDERRPVNNGDGKFSQRASTWLLNLDRRMPDGVPLASRERWHNMTSGEWMGGPSAAKFTSPWQDSPMHAIPF